MLIHLRRTNHMTHGDTRGQSSVKARGKSRPRPLNLYDQLLTIDATRAQTCEPCRPNRAIMPSFDRLRQGEEGGLIRPTLALASPLPAPHPHPSPSFYARRSSCRPPIQSANQASPVPPFRLLLARRNTLRPRNGFLGVKVLVGVRKGDAGGLPVSLAICRC